MRPSGAGRSPDSIEVRRARIDDAGAIARVHVDGWREAYGGRIPRDVLDSLDTARRTEDWRQWLGIPGMSCFVATLDGGIEGFCCLGPTRDERADTASTAEIPAIYVHPSRWRRGIGRRLWERALRDARERGFRDITLWVLESNAEACRFYEALGFARDGASKIDEQLTGTPLREIRFRRRT